MNYSRLVIAAFGGMVAYFIYGFLVFALSPLQNEFRQYPALYRSMESMQSHMMVGLLSTFVAILVVAVLYAMSCQGASGAAAGARFGALVGIFAVCAFVFHNYVNLNIGLRLTLLQAVAYFIEWVLVGLVIGLVYRPVRLD